MALVVGAFFAFLEAMTALLDGCLTPSQMKSNPVFTLYSEKYALTNHLGSWFNLFVMTPLIACMAASYHFVFNWYTLLALPVAIFLVWNFLRKQYARAAINRPEAHTYLLKTTPAGWVQMFYAIIAIWFMCAFYLTPLTPHPTVHEIVDATLVLSAYFIAGVIKVGTKGVWRWTLGMTLQVGLEIAVIVIIAFLKIKYL